MNSSPIGQVRATPQHVPSQYCSRGRPRISASLPPPPRPTTAYARKIQHVPYSVCAYIWSSDYLLVWVTVLHFDRYDHSNVHKSFQKKNLDFINGGKGGGLYGGICTVYTPRDHTRGHEGGSTYFSAGSTNIWDVSGTKHFVVIAFDCWFLGSTDIFFYYHMNCHKN